MHICKIFSIFAAKMRKSFYIYLLVGLFFASSLSAETLIVRTGTRVKGDIVFQNDEVVILRDAKGARFQYPRADVEAVITDDDAQNSVSPLEQEPEITTSKKASVLLELAGGAAVLPGQGAGGGFSADMLVGSHHIGDRHIFIGGGLGYHGSFIGDDKYNFLPIQVALRMPMIERKHAPMFGLSIGYGIALSKNYAGGIYAGVDVGYRCLLNPKTAVGLVLFSQFQQSTVSIEQTIEKSVFVQKSGRDIVTAGLKFALYF